MVYAPLRELVSADAAPQEEGSAAYESDPVARVVSMAYANQGVEIQARMSVMINDFLGYTDRIESGGGKALGKASPVRKSRGRYQVTKDTADTALGWGKRKGIDTSALSNVMSDLDPYQQKLVATMNVLRQGSLAGDLLSKAQDNDSLTPNEFLPYWRDHWLRDPNPTRRIRQYEAGYRNMIGEEGFVPRTPKEMPPIPEGFDNGELDESEAFAEGGGVNRDPILDHHYASLRDGPVKNKDGSTSTVFTRQIDVNGVPTLIPSVWDGKILDEKASTKRALAWEEETGRKWPTRPTHPELRAYDIEMHKEMGPPAEGFTKGGPLRLPKDKPATHRIPQWKPERGLSVPSSLNDDTVSAGSILAVSKPRYDSIQGNAPEAVAMANDEYWTDVKSTPMMPARSRHIDSKKMFSEDKKTSWNELARLGGRYEKAALSSAFNKRPTNYYGEHDPDTLDIGLNDTSLTKGKTRPSADKPWGFMDSEVASPAKQTIAGNIARADTATHEKTHKGFSILRTILESGVMETHFKDKDRGFLGRDYEKTLDRVNKKLVSSDRDDDHTMLKRLMYNSRAEDNDIPTLSRWINEAMNSDPDFNEAVNHVLDVKFSKPPK